MEEQAVHIISFNVPFPADYGGVIDIFYRIRFLHKAGVKIHLHVFEYGRGKQKELEKYCEQVYYYKRNKSFTKQLSSLPFIVASRGNADLLDNLLKDDYPILFEGLHTTFHIANPKLKNRRKIIRLHNVEHDYYNHLASSETKLFSKAFFLLEAGKLSRYEKIIAHADKVIAISDGDFAYFNKIHPNVVHIPGSHPYEKLTCMPGKGTTILYHGNLSVAENIQAAHYILDEIVPRVNAKFVFAGKNPKPRLMVRTYNSTKVDLYPNPSEESMNHLIEEAQIHLLPSVQNTGLKLKLLYSLFAGRFVIANPTMVDNSGLSSLCIVKSSPDEMVKAITEYLDKDFTLADVEKREKGLEKFTLQSLQSRWVSVLFN